MLTASAVRQPKSRKPYQTSEFKKKLTFLSPASAVRNTSKKQLKTGQIYAFYKLRWQIEPRGRPRIIQDLEKPF